MMSQIPEMVSKIAHVGDDERAKPSSGASASEPVCCLGSAKPRANVAADKILPKVSDAVDITIDGNIIIPARSRGGRGAPQGRPSGDDRVFD